MHEFELGQLDGYCSCMGVCLGLWEAGGGVNRDLSPLSGFDYYVYLTLFEDGICT